MNTDDLFNKLKNYPELIPRDISWLYFNHRVLQEADSVEVPLLEGLKFLAIYASNLQEFFKVRVASLRKIRSIGKENRVQMDLDIKPNRLLRIIKKIIGQQRSYFDEILFERILPELRKQGVHFHTRSELETDHKDVSLLYFEEEIKPHLTILPLEEKLLQENKIYFVGKKQERIFLIGLDQSFDRFMTFPEWAGLNRWLLLDDVVKLGLASHGYIDLCSFQINRDAEMVLDEHYSLDIIDQIKKGIQERAKGNVIRLVYSSEMTQEILSEIKEDFGLSRYELYPGSTYLDMNDLFSLVKKINISSLGYPDASTVPHPVFDKISLIDSIRERDIVLHYPYQSFSNLEKLIESSIRHPDLEEIRIVIYRTGDSSRIGELLVSALRKGLKVMVYIEAKARFDEEANIHWIERLKEEGALIIPPKKDLKVHSKLMQLVFQNTDNISYISSGNFNPATAKIYADHGLFTADLDINEDVEKVFQCIQQVDPIAFETKKLWVSPFSMRENIMKCLSFEMEQAKSGNMAYAILKMNNLEDPELIRALYEASRAGVKIVLLVRGICCLNIHFSEAINISASGIIDRYLEHARLFLFCNGGNERLYLSSSDWMTRNMDRRIELACPIEDEQCFVQLRALLNFQSKDNVKSRILDHRENLMLNNKNPRIRSQEDFRTYLAHLFKEQDVLNAL